MTENTIKRNYDRRLIMRRAWEIKKQNKRNIFSECLKMAWKEAKEMDEKEYLIQRLYMIRDMAAEGDHNFHYEASASEWNKYGKSRVYFTIYETRSHGSHNKKYRYGFYDNKSGRYFPEGKYNDLTKNYTLSGARM